MVLPPWNSPRGGLKASGFPVCPHSQVICLRPRTRFPSYSDLPILERTKAFRSPRKTPVKMHQRTNVDTSTLRLFAFSLTDSSNSGSIRSFRVSVCLLSRAIGHRECDHASTVPVEIAGGGRLALEPSGTATNPAGPREPTVPVDCHGFWRPKVSLYFGQVVHEPQDPFLRRIPNVDSRSDDLLAEHDHHDPLILDFVLGRLAEIDDDRVEGAHGRALIARAGDAEGHQALV